MEASDLLLIHTFMGLAMAAGTVIVGLVVLRPSPQCLISLQYLCQATLYGIGKIQPTTTTTLCRIVWYLVYLDLNDSIVLY